MLCAFCLPTLTAGSELTPPPTLWPLLPPAGPALAPHPAPPARPLRRTALRTFQSVPFCVPEQFKRVCKISRQGPHLMSPLMGTSVSGWPPLPLLGASAHTQHLRACTAGRRGSGPSGSAAAASAAQPASLSLHRGRQPLRAGLPAGPHSPRTCSRCARSRRGPWPPAVNAYRALNCPRCWVEPSSPCIARCCGVGRRGGWGRCLQRAPASGSCCYNCSGEISARSLGAVGPNLPIAGVPPAGAAGHFLGRPGRVSPSLAAQGAWTQLVVVPEHLPVRAARRPAAACWPAALSAPKLGRGRVRSA